MAIFSRRTLQRLINENASFLRRGQTKELVNRLNREDASVLDTEWEVVLLNAFSKFGKVEHEPNWGGTRPDIYFTSYSDPTQSVIADIVTVSDKGINEQTPINALFDEVLRVANQHGLRMNSFSIGIETDEELEDEETPPKIPARSRFRQAVLNENFSKFVESIVQAPQRPQSFQIRYEDTDILIKYHPTQEFAILSHPDYKEPTSITRNTVYNRLQEKAEKLSRCGYTQGSQAIIVCDGGNSLLSSGPQGEGYDIRKVIRHFLRQHPSISFVLTLLVKQHFGQKPFREVIATLYKGELFALIGDDIRSSINKLSEVMPQPERNSQNAINLLKGSPMHEGASFYGGLAICPDSIKISARTVLDLLAGKIKQKDFFKDYNFSFEGNESADLWNPFERKLQGGRLITGITLEKAETERDDDWLVIQFGSADPAISQFTVPAQDSDAGGQSKSSERSKAKG